MKIIDEFTNLPVSRQRKWQLRKQKLVHCRICGAPAISGMYCLEHMVALRERQRARLGSKKRNNSISYRLQQELQ